MQATIPVATASLRQNFIHILSSVSGTNTITATAFPGIAAYTYPTVLVITPANTNTAATTLNADARGAVAVQNTDGTACVGGELVAGIPALLALNSGGTAWIIQAPANSRLLTYIQKTGNYTLAPTDAAFITYFSGTGLTITIPASGIVGALFKIRNNGAGAHTLTLQTTPSQLQWFNGSTVATGNRTLAVGATILVTCSSTGFAEVEGSGIS